MSDQQHEPWQQPHHGPGEDPVEPHVRGENVHGPTGDPSASFSVMPEERRHHADPDDAHLVRDGGAGSSPWLWVGLVVAVVVVLVLLVALL
jgi:hypothetical protein